MSYHLRQRGREHIILERRRVAERWRTERWDSLRFQLPNQWLELPGKPYAGTDPNGFTHHSDVVRFIVDYAAEIAAPVRTGVEVTSLSPDEGSGGYALETTDGQINARHVVIATGPFQRPLIPDYSRAVPSWRLSDGRRLTTATRQNCRRARCWSSAAAIQAARLPMNCCTADGAYFSRSAAIAARPGAIAARMSSGGTKIWAASM